MKNITYTVAALLTLAAAGCGVHYARNGKNFGPTFSRKQSESGVSRTDLLKDYFSRMDSTLKAEEFDVILHEPSSPGLEHLILKCPLKEGEYKIGDKFGMRMHPIEGIIKEHTGIDFKAKESTDVYASYDGRVKFVGKDKKYGLRIVIEHLGGLVTTYNHLEDAEVKEGQIVTSSQKIGDVGNSGSATGYHLHWEVLKDGKFQNPLDYLQSRKTYVASRDKHNQVTLTKVL